MRAAKRDDALLEEVESIISDLKKQGFVLFYGWAHGGESNVVYWNQEHGGDWRKFLECAKALGTDLLYVNWSPFEEFQVEEALQRSDDGTPDDNKTDKRDPERDLQEIERYRDKVGLTAVIDVAFVHDEITHIYQESADWFDTFEALTEAQKERSSVSNGFAHDVKPVDKALVRKWASELAGHPRFRLARTVDQREYILESIAGDEIEKLPIGDILARADAIYQFELKPKEEERIGEQARILRKQGLNINAIAFKLGIPRDRVSALLSGD